MLFREAEYEDLSDLVHMLFDDPLGQLREDSHTPINPAYILAFEAILNDKNNELIIVEDKGDIFGDVTTDFYSIFNPYW